MKSAQYTSSTTFNIRRTDLIFPIFRNWSATEIYTSNGFDIALVQRLLQHSSASTTQRYIGIEPQKIEAAIQNHAQLL